MYKHACSTEELDIIRLIFHFYINAKVQYANIIHEVRKDINVVKWDKHQIVTEQDMNTSSTVANPVIWLEIQVT